MDFVDQIDIVKKYGYDHSHVLVGATPATAANYSVFWNITHPLEVMEVKVSWTTASTSGTLQIERLTGTTAPGSGTNILASTFDLAGTANTVNSKSGSSLAANRQFKAGDRMALVDGGTLTNLTDLVVTIYWKPLGRGEYLT